MNERELHQQKFQAQLDEWKANISKLKAKASGAEADFQLEMNKKITELDHKIHEASIKISQLAEAGEDTWASAMKGVEAGWDSLKTAVNDTIAKFKS